MAPQTRRKLSAQPNAGMPRDVGGRSMYMASPEYMATYARHLVQAGAKIIGGCCGTTPEHIHAMVEGIRPLAPRLAGRRGRRDAGASRTAAAVDRRTSTNRRGVEPVPFAERSRWAAKLARGQFVTSVEIVPPRGVDATRMLSDTGRLKAAGVDAVNVPDGPRAQSRMGALMTSVLIEQQVGIETVTHYACRDRNLLGMLSDLLGASAVGLRNLLVITGDPPKMGPYPDATAVFDVDAIGLTNLVSNLNRGLDPGGNAIGQPTRFAIGVGVNPVAIDPDHELRRFEWKVEAGRRVRDHAAGVRRRAARAILFARSANAHIPIIAGIWPLVSVRNAEFLANEVPGVSVPDDDHRADAHARTRSRRSTRSPRESRSRARCSSESGRSCKACRSRRRSAKSNWRSRYSPVHCRQSDARRRRRLLDAGRAACSSSPWDPGLPWIGGRSSRCRTGRRLSSGRA